MSEVVFNRMYAGYIYKGAGIMWHRRDDGGFNGVRVSLDGQQDTSGYVATGMTTKAKDGSVMVQVDGSNGFYDWIDISSGEWTRGAMYNGISQSQAQNYADRLIANNKEILMNNLFCARFADRLTTEEKQTLYGLQERLQERNASLASYGYTTSAVSSEAYGYGSLSSWLKNFMQSGVGLVITTTSIIISCVVVASVAAAAYFAYKYYYEQSARDVQFSNKLTKTLMSKLTEEEYRQLENETKGLVTKASIKARLGSTFDVIKLAIMAFGVYTIYTLFSTSKKAYGSKTRLSKRV